MPLTNIQFVNKTLHCHLLKNASFISKRFCSKEVRVRFAPSPTGFLHLGGLRTALYNYLFARQNNGKFILRIEDTDRTRLVDGATEALQDDLEWAGIRIDEGPGLGGDRGPYTQSERLNLYRLQVKLLLQNQSAYHCFCTDRRLNLLRKEAVRMRQIPKYDNRCRSMEPKEVATRLGKGEEHCIRFKLTSDCETFEDMIYGNIAYDVALNEGDPVIVKSDGFPTYHFANVVDDHFMGITHVLRGVEWQISTTKHILMYRAFNWKPPKYAHLPLLMNADGTKLSKRQGDIQISNYRKDGILPLALINFITNSGGGFSKDVERHLKPKIYTMDELTDQFDINRINVHSGRLMADRLLEFNTLELERQMNDESCKELLISNLQELIKKEFQNSTSTKLQIDKEHITSILKWSLNRISKLSDLLSKDLRFLWVIPENSTIDNVSNKEVILIENLSKDLTKLNLGKESVNNYLKDASKQNDVPFKSVMKLLRYILSGLKEGPSVAEMMEILGKENVQLRFNTFLNKNKHMR